MMVDLTLSVPTDRKLQSAESWAYHRALVARSPELYQPETLRRLRSGENIVLQAAYAFEQLLPQPT